MKQSYKDIAEVIKKEFPETQVILTLGNNDGLEDYEIPKNWPKGNFLDFLHSIFENLAGEIPSLFYIDGFYSTVTESGYNVLVMNSLIFSAFKENLTNPARIQLFWLKNELEMKSKVIIAMHIPTSFSLYGGGIKAWNDEYSKIFIELVKKYSSKIVLIVGGHYHSGYFQLIGKTPLVLHPSISPIHGNNPGFRYYDLEEMDYTEFTLNGDNSNEGWHSASFSSVYGYPMNYERLYEDIKSGEVTIDKYMERVTGFWVLNNYSYQNMCNVMFGKACAQGNQHLKKVVLCDIQYSTEEEFNHCIKY